MQTAPKKIINAWAMYDWANSAYNLVITSTIFPGYWELLTGDSDETTPNTVDFLGRTFNNTSLYYYALGIAFLLVSVTSPILSSIADTRGNKKNFMGFFMTLGSMACAGLFFFVPGRLELGVGFTILACYGYWASNVFYNSYLPDIAAPADRDRISARGFSFGYIGSVLLQGICLIFIFFPTITGEANYLNVRIAFLLTGIWWFGFALIPLSRLPKPPVTDKPNRALAAGYLELKKVWQEVKHLPVLKRFLASFFFYNMGVQTVMLVAALYGKSELGIPLDNLIISIIIIQLVAIPGAIVISRLSERIGNLRALMICVAFWVGDCIYGYLLPAKDINQFYILATLVGFVMGGIQSLSRSTYSKLMPPTKDTTSFFSFYDVTEKIAIVIGMFSFGYITELAGSQRNAVLALISFFVIGFFFLLYTLRTQMSKANETVHD